MLDATTRARCAELALAPGRPFDIAHRFLSPTAADRALALEALFSILRELPLASSDPAPGLAQLAWWQQEIARAPAQGSQHPVVRALLETGGLDAFNGDAWASYLQETAAWLTDGVVSDRDALWQRLESLAACEARLAAGLSSAPGTGSVRLLNLLARLEPEQAPPAWVPLDLVARHGAAPDARGLGDLAADLAQIALARDPQPPPRGAMEEPARLVHLNTALANRLLRRLQGKPQSRLARGADRLGPADVFCAWRWARRWSAA